MSGTFAERIYRENAELYCAVLTFQKITGEQARERDLTSQEYLLLVTVRGHRKYPRLSIHDVADAMKVKDVTASYLVDRGVRQGLVQRSEDPADRRRAIVCLSSAGQRLLDDIMAATRLEGEPEPLRRIS